MLNTSGYVTLAEEMELIWTTPSVSEPIAIGQVWGYMKHYVRSSLHRFTWADLKARLEEARICATEEMWAAAAKRTSTTILVH